CKDVILLTCFAIRAVLRCYSVSMATSYCFKNQSTAATRPTISSLATFIPRPMVLEFGELFFFAASIRSFLPRSNPVHCGPRIPFPPENVTRSKPICVYFHKFEIGGTSAAASLKQGTPCWWATRNQSSRLILPAPALKK